MRAMERRGFDAITGVGDWTIIFALAALSAAFAWVGAQAGLMGLVALVGLLGAIVMMVIAPPRFVLLAALPLSLTLLLHKSFGELVENVASGALGITISSQNLVLVGLYLLWFLEGRMGRDLAWAARKPVFIVPIVGALLMSVSLLVSSNVYLSTSELIRMGWMYLLFLFVGARIRERREVWIVLGGLGVFAVVQFVVAVLQWKTGGVLGLSFLGVPTELTERTLDVGRIGRPFGTMIHPVFMGAVLANVALVALAISMYHRDRRVKVGAFLLVPMCLLPIMLAHTRGPAIAFVIAATVLLAVGLAQRLISAKTISGLVLAVLVVVVAFFPQISSQFTDNFRTGQFGTEIESRWQLNEVGLRMFYDSPVVGTGLNNFTQIMDGYAPFTLLFPGFPSHNIFLLQLAETGLVGLLALVLVGVSLSMAAVRLASSRDPLFAAIGVSMASIYVFYFFEEQLSYTLRAEVPLAIFWMLAGLSVACLGMDEAAGGGVRRLRIPQGDGSRTGSRRFRPKATAAEAISGSDSDDILVDAVGSNASPHGTRLVWAAFASFWIRVGLTVAFRCKNLRPAAAAAAGTGAAVPRRLHPVSSPSSESGDACAVPPSPLDDIDSALKALGVDTGEFERPSVVGIREDGGPSTATDDRTVRRARFGPAFPRNFRLLWGATALSNLGDVRWHTRRLVGAAMVLLLFAGVVRSEGAAVAVEEGTTGLQIVFSAFDRATGEQALYRSDADGGEIVRITPVDGGSYSWPAWARNGTKILYSVRYGPAGSPENIILADPDGSNPRQLTDSDFRIDQPRMSADGTSVVFTAFTEESPTVALFSMDLRTLEVRNLSARANQLASFDSDPRWTPDNRIVFSHSLDVDLATTPTQLWTMDGDGANRTPIVKDQFFNVDADVSPSGGSVVYGSYRGEGSPVTSLGSTDPFQLKLSEWFLVVADLATSQERVLNAGGDCTARPVEEPCAPLEGPAAVPTWTPDGTEIGFISVHSSGGTCICATNLAGDDARSLISTTDLAINHFDWARPGEVPPSAVSDAEIGSAVPDDRFIFGGGGLDGPTILATSGPDRWGAEPIDLPAGFVPSSARWSADRSKVVLTARVDYDTSHFDPQPAPPAGEERHVHFTIDQPFRLILPQVERPEVGQNQAFILDVASGSLTQLTTPWTEDWMDALPDGEARGNIDPDISPDGRYVVVTNVSSTTGEAALLRIDLDSGEVYNLTNATAGAVPATDVSASFSPDGTRIAFSSAVGEFTQVFVVDAATGKSIRQVTQDTYDNLTPTWSPDGRTIAYASYRGRLTSDVRLQPSSATTTEGGVLWERATESQVPDWYLVTVDVDSGAQQVVSTPEQSPVFSPTYSPTGDRIAYISTRGGQPDIFIHHLATGSRRNLFSFRTFETFFDWR